MSATAYTAYDDGNGSYTYRGNLLRKGLVAVDPAQIPLGTRLYIEGYGYAIADDVGGAIKGNKIDLAFDNRADALQFGRRNVTVHILN
jgi:3D (Asp-Asp-Asp) domain-containing protein